MAKCALLASVAVVLGILAVAAQPPKPATPAPVVPAVPAAATGHDLTFCFWNVENLFDDRDDKRNSVDEPFDTAFSKDDELRKLKYDRLATTFLKMNAGKGPDIIACVEVESVQAATLLMAALNAKIDDDKMKYKAVAMKNLDAGRHIAPCVISRYPLSQASTKLHGRDLRILETRLYVNNHNLTILATHWTSKITRNDGSSGESGRANYARTIAGVYTAQMKRSPGADIIVCGDFNAMPDEDEVTKDLRAIGDRDAVKASAGTEKPMLLDLLAGKKPEQFGTIWYDNKPLIYDHICVSPGLLDEAGWSCAPASVQVVTAGLIRPGSTRRQPWRFDDPGRRVRPEDRGFSDHFPVILKMHVDAAATPPMIPAKPSKP